MQTLQEIFDTKTQHQSLEQVLAACKEEQIPEGELAELLDKYLIAVQAKKRTEQYWEKVKEDQVSIVYNPQEMELVFKQEYQKRFGVEFTIDEYSQPILTQLCHYFTKSPEFEASGKFSLKKGLLLFGNVGSGKSSLMQCFTRNQKQGFKVINCLNVSSEYSQNGYEALTAYSTQGTVNRFPSELWGQKISTYCFDDLGVEREKKHFGNEVNVMGDLIQMIYDSRKLVGHVHFTTNLTGAQLKEYYGDRVASRLREMVNIIGFDPESPDRRK